MTDQPGTPPPPATEERISRTSGAFGNAAPPARPATLRERLRAALRKPFEDPNPILLKELRATFRTALFIRFLYLLTGFVGLFVLTWGAFLASGETPPADVGKIVFHVFFSTIVVVLSFVAPTYAAGSITGEKRAGTFESLILSGMSPARIVWGKFVASFAAIVLVVIAVSPVVGMAFLFGGISPLAVLTGFAWVLMWLAPAVAFGIAVSARVESMWVAIVIAFVVYATTCMMFVWPLTVGLGELAHDEWGTPEGPFWFAEAFPQKLDSWQGWAFLGLVPLYFLGMPVWFFLASAIAGVQPAAEDRSTPLKVWAIPAILGEAAIAVCAIAAFASTHDQHEFGVFASMMTGFLVVFLALLYCNEPPLPPRPQGPPSLLARMLSPIGPGAAGTLRFSLLAIGAASGLVPLIASAIGNFVQPGRDVGFDASLMAIAVGHFVCGFFFAALATWLRLMLRNGLAARVLTLAVLAGAVLLPFLGTMILDPHALDRMDREIPPLLMISPLLPDILAIDVGLEHDMPAYETFRVIVPVMGYGLCALALWIAVEVRCVRARRLLAERRARLLARVAPPAPAHASPAPDATTPDAAPDAAPLPPSPPVP